MKQPFILSRPLLLLSIAFATTNACKCEPVAVLAGGPDVVGEGEGEGEGEAEPCDPSTTPFLDDLGATVSDVNAVVAAGDLLVVSHGNVVSAWELDEANPTRALPGTAFDHIQGDTAANERFFSLALYGSVLAASANADGGSIAIADVVTAAAARRFDLDVDAGEFEAAVTATFPSEVFAPSAGLVTANQSHIFLQERTYGALLVISTSDLNVDGFLWSDADDGPLLGATHLFWDGGYLYALVDRSGGGGDGFRGIRSFYVGNPTNPQLIATVELPFGGAGGAYHHPVDNRLWVSELRNDTTTAGRVHRFDTGTGGEVVAHPSSVIALAAPDQEARGILVEDGIMVLATPSFGPSPATAAKVLRLDSEEASGTEVETLPMPDGVYGDQLALSEENEVVFVLGTTLQTIQLLDCLD